MSYGNHECARHSWVIDQCVEYIKSMSKQKDVTGRTRRHLKNPRSKGQHRIGIMNVRDTSNHGRSLFQIW